MAGAASSARILYLDDEEPIVFLVTRMLEVLGHKPIGHTRASDALTAFRNDPDGFDLVLSDQSMPGSSGLEFAQQVLALRPDAAVAVLSGHVKPEDVEAALAMGALGVVEKPHTIDDMSRIVGELLEQKTASLQR